MKQNLVIGLFTLAVWKVSAAIIPVDPTLTYLMTYQDAPDYAGGIPVGGAVPIDLGALGLVAGEVIQLNSMGSYYYHYISDPADPFAQAYGMIGVFSSSTTLLPNDQLNRVVGAIAAGTPVPSLMTYYGNFSTDIPEDFYITGGVVLTIPAGAQYLFVSADDSLFWDNVPGPSGFQLSIQQVPDEGLTIATLALGISGLAFIRRLARSNAGDHPCPPSTR
jgi:hypothetical protein